MFMLARPGLLRIARRIMGDADDAEFVIQETWLRRQRTDRTVVLSPRALLRTTTVRPAINLVRSAQHTREFCGNPDLPEPVDGHATPEAVAERHDAVERTVLLMKQTLTPTRRGACLQREAFRYPYGRIAGMLGITTANTRQQASRAQQRLGGERRGRPVDAVAQRRLVEAFFAAARSGELARLERVLVLDAK